MLNCFTVSSLTANAALAPDSFHPEDGVLGLCPPHPPDKMNETSARRAAGALLIFRQLEFRRAIAPPPAASLKVLIVRSRFGLSSRSCRVAFCGFGSGSSQRLEAKVRF